MAELKESAPCHVVDGHYKVTGTWYRVILVNGVSAVMIETPMGDVKVALKYGQFGEADPKIFEMTNQKTYNIELSYKAYGSDMKELGVVYDDGVKIITKGATGIAEFDWTTGEEARTVLDDGDDITAPSCPYRLQPENQGRLVWFTGPPGLGKSTTAQLLARNSDYVYYEADCFFSCRNPYIPVDVPEPSMEQINQRPLKGEGLEQRKQVCEKFFNELAAFYKGDHDKNVHREFYDLMCEDIKRERARIGGDWAVANAVASQEFRDFIR